MKQNRLLIWPPIVIILLAFGVAVSRLMQSGLWADEAWSMWVVYGSPAETVRRIAADVHPPLYFIILNGWTAAVGQSIYGARVLSALFGMLGLAATYRLGKELFDSWTGIIATLWLGTSSFFIYYTHEIRMYSMLLCLATWSMWAYLRWLRRATPARLAIYGVTIAALPYTHYYGLLVTLAQGLHLLLTRPQRLRSWFLGGGLAFALYAPWLPVFWQQIRANPNGPLTLPLPTNWDTIRWLLILLSGGAGIVALAPFVLGQALPRLRRYGNAILLLLLWSLLTPLVVLTLNAWISSLYEARYVIAILPAVALLVAYGVRHIFWRPLAVILLTWLIYTNLTSYAWLWPARTSWDAAIAQVLETRQPGEPSLVMIMNPDSLEAYYDRELGIRNAAALDLSGERYRPAEMQAIVASFALESPVWVIMPNNLGETWATVAALDRQRHAGYRRNADYMLFYRFDRPEYDDLQFRFGDKLRYEGSLFSNRPTVQAGEQFCPELALTALMPLADSYAFGVHLVNAANTLVAQHDEGLGARAAGEQILPAPCLNIPPDIPPGDYYLHLVVYSQTDGRRLPLYEGDTAGVFWGDALVFETITVQ